MTAARSRVLFQRPAGLTDVPFSYCPGCTHGIVHRLVAESLDELGLTGTAVGVVPVGCSVTAYNFFNCDIAQAAHGRAPAVATGIKRARPETTVFAYQGDGDLAAIGTAETVHAAARGELITVIFINNAIYGMTGGQMAPTSLPEQITQTSPYGRDPQQAGYPLRVVEMLSTLDGVALAQRVSVDAPRTIRAAKRAIKKAFTYQRDGAGYSIIEVLSTCPTNWGLTPEAAISWLQDNLMPYYPPGVYRDIQAEGFATVAEAAQARRTALAEGSGGSQRQQGAAT
jgi:2-oxoglutarate ferredoxin oxidoreductase subunit beta